MNNETKIILDAINAKYGVLTRQHLKEEFGELITKTLAEIDKRNEPTFYSFTLGRQPFVLDYKNRRHVFAFNYNNSSVTLNTADGKAVSLPPQVWSNMGFQPGTSFTSTSTSIIELKCTDEVIP